MIASPQELPDLLADVAHLGIGDGGEGRVEGGGVEVRGGVRVEQVDVDGAPVVVQGSGGDLVDDGHFFVGRLLLVCCVGGSFVRPKGGKEVKEGGG